jgi:hypothetical protein
MSMKRQRRNCKGVVVRVRYRVIERETVCLCVCSIERQGKSCNGGGQGVEEYGREAACVCLEEHEVEDEASSGWALMPQHPSTIIAPQLN